MPKQIAYGKTAKVLHWLIAALLAVQLPIGLADARHPAGHGSLKRDETAYLHRLVILMLIVLRLVWRLFRPVAPANALPRWQRFILLRAVKNPALQGRVQARAGQIY